ncbi:unnamed protein product [Mytilus coruscus]|uniref:Uncharacterized protein n=1 Tax=Mytilus coruscus TaxID=42192 RepID=A0A6J8BCP7_MYTCO|nr:unnamed protein product [Mytilus coruscus]
MKRGTKKKAATISNEHKKTGGGVTSFIAFSKMEKDIVAVVGEEIVFGIQTGCDTMKIRIISPENNLIESMDVPIETNEENNNVKYITEPQGTHENPQDVQINNKKISTLIFDALNGDYKNIPVAKVVNFESVRTAILWLKENNILYCGFPDLHTCLGDIIENQANSEDTHIQNEVQKLIKIGHKSATVPVDYTLPDIEIDSLLRDRQQFQIPVQFNKPTWLSQVPHGEELAFPWLFPEGKGGIYDSRSTKVSVLEYFQYRLYNKDARWRKNITYLMYAVNHMEQSKLSNEIEIQMRLKKSDGKLTAGTLSQNSNLSNIKQNSFMFMKNIRGTVAY